MDKGTILLDHGAGGRASHRLVTDLFVRHFGGQNPGGLEDCALLDAGRGKIALSTDSFTVTPIFFPGGDIGELAVNGTVNDVAMRGARPVYLSVAFILEEGLDLGVLERIVESMARAAKKAGVAIVAGDTKVVPRGAADGIFINTTGIGLLEDDLDIASTRARPGDQVLISGTMADHGVTILCQREGLTLESEVKSDTASLAGLIREVIRAGGSGIHVLRDPTRGGVATTLNEIAVSSGIGIRLFEDRLPVHPAVRGACDILGLDPLYVANEGKLLVLAAPECADRVLEAMTSNELGRQADIIGEAAEGPAGRVFLETAAGGSRIVDMLSGEQLPRIC